MGADTEVTARLAAWTSSLGASAVPQATARRAGWQWASVIGAILGGAGHPHSRALGAVARRTGGPGPATLLPELEGATVEGAVWANAGRSVLLDYDDYLFAGHTGHSSVLVSLAVGELLSSPGGDLLAATVAANEAAGRLGAAMLAGPHNGQMWAYIHNLAGAVAAARLLHLDASTTAHAIGLALTEPPYPLAATFMGSDGKALTAAGPAVDGLRAAFLAAEGLRCEVDVLTDRAGFFAGFHPDALTGMFSGYGSAWLTDSLCYKVYPGCAYLDTAIDALVAILDRHHAKVGAPLAADEVEAVQVRAGMLTVGMEAMSGWYRGPGGRLRDINMCFSVAYSAALTLLAGELTPAQLDPAWWEPRAKEIEDLAARVEVNFDEEMNREMASRGAGFDLAAALGDGKTEPVLDGAVFTDYEMRFPAEVEVVLRSGDRWRERCDVPLGGAGRPPAETRDLVRAKLEGNGASPGSFDALERLAELPTARDIAALLAAR